MNVGQCIFVRKNEKRKMKNVIFLINNLNRGGAERQFLLQMNSLYKIHEGVFFTSLTNTKQDGYLGELQIPKANQFNLNLKHWLNPRIYLKLRKIIKKNNIKVIYSTLELSNIVARIVKLFVPKVKIYIRESGTSFVDKKGKPTFKSKKFKFLDKILNRFSEKIILVSQEMKKFAEEIQPTQKNKMDVLVNGVEMKIDQSKAGDLIKKRLQHQDLIILMVGSLNWREKAYEDLFEAVAILKKQNKEYVGKLKIKLAGAGYLLDFYKNKTKELGIENQVEFLGRLDSVKLDEQYMCSSIFVFASVSEGSPNVILEAMSFALPVISTKVGSAPEMIDHKQDGFLVDKKSPQQIAQYLDELVTNKELREKIGAKGFEKIKNQFSIENKIKELIQVLGLRSEPSELDTTKQK